jgi:hypothetical protein
MHHLCTRGGERPNEDSMTEPFSFDHIGRSVAFVAHRASTAEAHQIPTLVEELDFLAEQLIGRYDDNSVAQKVEVQRLVHELCPARSAYPPAVTREP